MTKPNSIAHHQYNLIKAMKDLKHLELWFVTGSQHLYGEETLRQVATHSDEIEKKFTPGATDFVVW